jgi:ABC-2 type transport system ATP-binding protein
LRLHGGVRHARGLATSVVRALDQAGITVDDVEVHQPSLDDVFFALTGHPSSPPVDSTVEDPSDSAPDAADVAPFDLEAVSR